MKRFKSVLCCLFFLFGSVIFVSAQNAGSSQPDSSNWIGKYQYNYSEGETAGGASTLIEYSIVVSKKGDALVARFIASGYQANTDYECRAEASGNKLNLYVVRDAADHGGETVDYTVKPGQLLASLAKTVVRGKVAYKFINGKYEIFPNNISAKNPVYFKRRG